MNASTPIDDPSLKLPRPFVRALVAAGLTSLGAAWAWSDDELLALHGRHEESCWQVTNIHISKQGSAPDIE